MKGKVKNVSAVASQDAGKPNVADAARGDGPGAPFREGKWYEGKVIGGDNKSQTYAIALNDARVMDGCIYAAGGLAGLAGFAMNYLLPRGTEVGVRFGNPPLILSVRHSDMPDEYAGSNKDMTQTMTGGRGALDDPEYGEWEGAGARGTIPRDLLEGEIDISNSLGVGVRFLHTLMSMTGGERAKVETCLLNDMVRIISDTYKHHSAFGDMQIYNDGGLNVRFDGTSYEHEAWGLRNREDKKADVQGAEVGVEEDLVRTGRHRFSMFLGRLGDFLHMFVSEPADALTSIAEDAVRPGKGRFQIMADGTILGQSTTEIAFERVVRVQVPTEKRRWDDPEGTTADEFKSLNAQFAKLWDFGGKGAKSIHHTAYQLREYARWLSCFHSYARFHQQNKDWDIPREDETAHSWGNQEPDREAANSNGPQFIDAYATIRIMRDGTIVTWDGYGGAIVQGKSGIQFSTAENMDFDVAGDCRFTVGGDFLVKARRNVEISAIVGGMILKARSWWRGLCERGLLWIKGDAPDPAVEVLTDNPAGDPPDNPTLDQQEYAVIVEASQGRAVFRSERTAYVQCTGEPDDNENTADVTASVVVGSRQQDVRLYGERNVAIKSNGTEEGTIALEVPSAVIINAPNLFITSRLVDIRQTTTPPPDGVSPAAITINNGKLTARQVAADFIGAQIRLAGPKMPAVIDDDEYPVPDGCCLPVHFGHINIIDEFDANDFATEDDLSIRTDYEGSALRPLLFESLNESGLTWDYPNASEYRWPGENDADQRPRFEPLAQQRIRWDDSYTDRVDSWEFETYDVLLTAPRTGVVNLPMPGRGARELVHPDDAGDPLHQPLAADYKDQNAQTGLQSLAITRKYRKRDTA